MPKVDKTYVMGPHEDLDDVLDREFSERAFIPAVGSHTESRLLGFLQRPGEAWLVPVREEL